MMKTPTFWYQDKSVSSPLATALSPLSWLYRKASTIHKNAQTSKSIDIPVICLGNLNAGGSGKTPTAIALQKLLNEEHLFLSPAFVTRGYRGRVNLPERVDLSSNATMWGDESILLARHAPTFVSSNRYIGSLLALSQGADAIILDDGLQHYSLEKDVSFAVVDGVMGFGNERVIPAGPLRQPLKEGFDRVDAFILIGKASEDLRKKLPADKPVFTAQMQVSNPSDLPSKGPYIGFCGIGFPSKFKTTLETIGVDLVGWHTYADHHPYSIADMQNLIQEALDKKARLITTEKDYVRLPDFLQKSMIDCLPIEIVFDAPDTLVDFIRQKTSDKTKPA